jgi:hypothetical protein
MSNFGMSFPLPSYVPLGRTPCNLTVGAEAVCHWASLPYLTMPSEPLEAELVHPPA